MSYYYVEFNNPSRDFIAYSKERINIPPEATLHTFKSIEELLIFDEKRKMNG